MAGVLLALTGTALVPTTAQAAADPPHALPSRATAGDYRYAPDVDYDTDSCYNVPAIGPDGRISEGLPNTDNGLTSKCRDKSDLDNTNAYARSRCNSGWCIHLYDYYFEKDKDRAVGVGDGGHRHDWEHVAVWTLDGRPDPQYVSVSGHGDFDVYPAADVRWDGTHPKVVYHKDGVATHRFRIAGTGDEPPENAYHTWRRPDLVSWNGFPAGLRDALVGHDFGHATMALTDKSFAHNIDLARPSSGGGDGTLPVYFFPFDDSRDEGPDSPGVPDATGSITGSNKCVDVEGDDAAARGAAVQLWGCQSYAGDQHWTHNADQTLTTMGRCLDLAGGATTSGTRVQLWDCNGGGGQKWVQQPNGTLINPQSKRCLNSPDGSQLQLSDCSSDGSELFSIEAGSPITGKAGKCIDVAGDDAGGNSATIQLWDCQTSAIDQHWFRDSRNRLRTLGRCLDIDGSKTAAGTPVHLYDCNDGGGQVWEWQPATSALRNPQSGRCLDLPDGDLGKPLRLWDCDGSDHQQFSGWLADGPGGGGSEPPATGPLRIMPLGDSITWGSGSSTGSSYRADLWNRLGATTDTVDFLGSQQTGALPDRDNEGHPGWTIDGIRDQATGWVSQDKPEIVTLMIGTNDANQNYNVDTAPARLGALIDQILAAAPRATVLVASLVPATDPAVEARVTEINKAIPGIVEARRDAGKHVAFVDMSGIGTADLADSLHPNDWGYHKMANAFFDAIQQAASAKWIRDPGPGVPDSETAPPLSADAATAAISDARVDFDGDGRSDYLILGDTGALQVYLNNGGDGHAAVGWAPQGQVSTGNGTPASGLQLADIDADGRTDYLYVAGDGSVHAYVNHGGDGHGGWVDRGQIASGTGAPGSRVRFADIDGDKRADYLVLGDGGSVHAWLNKGGDGNGAWADAGEVASGVGVAPEQVRFADYDGDGKADYLTVSDNGAVNVFLNKGDDGHGGWNPWAPWGQVASGTGRGNQIRLADFDGDGKADYLVVGDDSSTKVWLNNGGDGHGGWTEYGQVAAGTGVPLDQVRFADFDGDGKADYVTVADSGASNVYLNQGGDGHGKVGWTPMGQVATGVGAPPGQIRMADMDGDKKVDYLVVANDGSVQEYRNNGGDGHGAWIPMGTIMAAGRGSGRQIRFADIDGDGRADYVVMADNGAMHVWLNQGSGSSAAGGAWYDDGTIATGVAEPASRVRLADFDGDGKADYLVVADNGSVRAWINKGGDGHGGWAEYGQVAAGIGAPGNQIRFSDFDGDGKADYLAVDGKGAITAYLNRGGDGHGTWAPYGTVASGAAPGDRVRI